jgi:hypothetical protein
LQGGHRLNIRIKIVEWLSINGTSENLLVFMTEKALIFHLLRKAEKCGNSALSDLPSVFGLKEK